MKWQGAILTKTRPEEINLAGEELRPNNSSGATQFSILVSSECQAIENAGLFLF